MENRQLALNMLGAQSGTSTLKIEGQGVEADLSALFLCLLRAETIHNFERQEE